jgi:hypothetical protein
MPILGVIVCLLGLVGVFSDNPERRNQGAFALVMGGMLLITTWRDRNAIPPLNRRR